MSGEHGSTRSPLPGIPSERCCWRTADRPVRPGTPSGEQPGGVPAREATSVAEPAITLLVRQPHTSRLSWRQRGAPIWLAGAGVRNDRSFEPKKSGGGADNLVLRRTVPSAVSWGRFAYGPQRSYRACWIDSGRKKRSSELTAHAGLAGRPAQCQCALTPEGQSGAFI